MNKITILNDDYLNKNNNIYQNEWYNNKMFCIESKKIFIDGSGKIKTSEKYLTIDDKLIIDVERKSQDLHNISFIDNIKNINGVHDINNKELNIFLDSFNDDYISLEDSINKMTPLLEMLEKGEYYIGYVNIFPTTSEGNFFWDLSTDSRVYNSIDYAYLLPMYIRGTENYHFYNEDRVNYYLDRYNKTTTRPTPIIINLSGYDYENVVLDGHHKIIASYLNNEPIRAIMIMKNNKYVKDALTPTKQKGLFNIKLINNHPSSVSTIFSKIEYNFKDKYKSHLNKDISIEYQNIFNNTLYKTNNKYPNLSTLIHIYHTESSSFVKDEDGLDLRTRCFKLLNLFVTDRNKTKEYALKIANQTEYNIDVYLAFKMLSNYQDKDVKEFFLNYYEYYFSDYYSNYEDDSKIENSLYKIALDYLELE